MAEPLIAHKSVWRLAGFAAMGAGVCAIGVWMMRTGDPELLGPGVIMTLLFGAMILVVIGQMLRHGPVITVDARGIWWARWKDQVIPWSSIESAQVQWSEDQRYLCLKFHDHAKFEQQWLLDRFAKLSRRLGYGDLSINTLGTDRDFDALVDAVSAHLAEYGDQRVGTGSAPE